MKTSTLLGSARNIYLSWKRLLMHTIYMPIPFQLSFARILSIFFEIPVEIFQFEFISDPPFFKPVLQYEDKIGCFDIFMNEDVCRI